MTSPIEDTALGGPGGEGGVQKGLEGYPEGSRQLANGTVVGPNGKFLTGPDREHMPIPYGDSQAASAISQRRKDRAAKGAMIGLAAAAVADAGPGAVKGIGGAVAHYTKAIGEGVLANAVGRPYDASRALDKMLKWARLVDEQRASAQANVLVAVSGGPELEAIEAEWRDDAGQGT